MELKHSPEAARGERGRSKFLAYTVLAGAIAGCAGGFIAVPYETARLPDNGDACPSVGPAFQVFQGQEVGFGNGRRPLYVARVSRMDGTDVTMDLRMPLAAPTTRASTVSWVVTFKGVRTDTDGLGRLANASCRVIGDIRGPAQSAVSDGGSGGTSPTDARAEAGAAGAPAVDGGARTGAAGSPAQAAPVERPRELDSPLGFPPDSSGEFSRRLSEGLAGALGSLQALMRGDQPSGGARVDFTVQRSDDSGFTLSAGSGTYTLSRRVELQWDVSVPSAATLRIPYTIRSMSTEGGRVSAVVALDCSRDMEAVGPGLDVRSGPHPSCNIGPAPSQKK